MIVLLFATNCSFLVFPSFLFLGERSNGCNKRDLLTFGPILGPESFLGTFGGERGVWTSFFIKEAVKFRAHL